MKKLVLVLLAALTLLGCPPADQSPRTPASNAGR